MLDYFAWAIVSMGFVSTTVILVGIVSILIYDWWQNR